MRSCIAVLLLTGLVVAIAPAARIALAALHNPIPLNSSEEPTEDFTDADALFAYVTSDIAGGRVLVEGAITDPNAASCDHPAWGTENTVLGIGSIFVPIQGPPLEPGEWRLLVEDSIGGQHALSAPFYVTPCPGCSHAIGLAAVQEFKNAASANRVGAATTCVGLSAKDIKVAGTGARGKIKGLTDKAAAFEAGTAGFLATVIPSGGGLVLSFELPSEHAAEEKAMEILKNLTCGLSFMYADIVADPIDTNYTAIVQPEFSTTTAVEIPVGDAAVQAIDRLRAFGLAELSSSERYLGAKAANNERYVHAQASAIANLGRQHIDELKIAAAALRDFAVELDSQSEFAEPVVTQERRDQLAAVYARVRTEGFTAEEISELHGLGLSDARSPTSARTSRSTRPKSLWARPFSRCFARRRRASRTRFPTTMPSRAKLGRWQAEQTNRPLRASTQIRPAAPLR